jgi:hypothetical protein
VRRLLYCLTGLGLLVSAAYGAEPFTLLTLTVPVATGTDEAVWLDATVGALPRGSFLNIETEDGRLIGTISPYGVTALTPQTYKLVLPKDTVKGSALRIRVQIQQPDGTLRVPMSRELLGVKLARVNTDN